MARMPPRGAMAYFQINTIAPPTTMPARAPHLLVRFQNRAQSITGPKAAPKPPQAKETMENTLPSFLAQIIPMIAITITAALAMITLVFLETLIFKVS